MGFSKDYGLLLGILQGYLGNIQFGFNGSSPYGPGVEIQGSWLFPVTPFRYRGNLQLGVE